MKVIYKKYIWVYILYILFYIFKKSFSDGYKKEEDRFQFFVAWGVCQLLRLWRLESGSTVKI